MNKMQQKKSVWQPMIVRCLPLMVVTDTATLGRLRFLSGRLCVIQSYHMKIFAIVNS